MRTVSHIGIELAVLIRCRASGNRIEYVASPYAWHANPKTPVAVMVLMPKLFDANL